MLADPEAEQELPLLRTKLSPPPLPREFVPRPRLVAQINRAVRGPLTLLSAPAGFGKTSLVTEWAAQSSLSIAWLTLNREDNDLFRFFRYLTGALQEVNPELGKETLSFIYAAKSSGMDTGLTLLINELLALASPIVLVIDDCHVLDEPSIYHGLDFLLKHLPRQLRLVIASRRQPPLDLALLRAKGRVTELGADELRFTGEEVFQFFEQKTGLQLTLETVQVLEARTEGWVTALQLAAISLRSEADLLGLLEHGHGDARYLVDYLCEEVLSRQPEDVYAFLLRSSILDTVCGPLCEAVVDPDSQPGYGAAMLARLERDNLFLMPQDPQREWFRFHPLFADFLRRTALETNPTEMPELYRRAALWFEQRADLEEAFRYALEVGDGEWAAGLIERHTDRMIASGEFFALTRWIGILPGEVIHRHPRLSLGYVWGSMAAYQLDNARYWLDDLERSLESAEILPGKAVTADGSENGPLWNIRGGVASCRSSLALIDGKAQEAAEYSRKAARYLGENNPFIRSMHALEDSWSCVLAGDTRKAIEMIRDNVRMARRANNPLVFAAASRHLAHMQALQGHLSQALATLKMARFAALGPDGQPLALAGIVDVEFGEILRERDLLDEAKEHLERGMRQTQAWWLYAYLDGAASLARLRQSQGDFDGAEALLIEAAQQVLGPGASLTNHDIMLTIVAVSLAVQRNDLAAAARWWGKSDVLAGAGPFSSEAYPYDIYEHLQLARARFLLAGGRDSGDNRQVRQAIEIVEAILPQAEQFGRVTSKIEILVFEALAQAALREPESATPLLMKALALGEPEDYRRIFLDEGKPMAELLNRCLQIQTDSRGYLPSRGYIESLLEAMPPVEGAPFQAGGKPTQGAAAKTEDGLAIAFSAREVQILSLIAAGKSNQEISAELYLALTTVKHHASNIYAKLQVNKRTQAVSRARQLGLIL